MFSTVILTLNEEKALPRCLASLKGCNDVVVVDSGSTDSTVAIAKAAGARVFVRTFDDFAGQRNFAQREIRFLNPWVFHLDADEQMTPELMGECRSKASRKDLDGFRVAPKMIFEGRWVRHCTDYPAYQARFVRAPQFSFVQVGHGQREDPGMATENMRENYLHDMSIYGRDAWVAKHRGYARAEAASVLSDAEASSWRLLFSAVPIVRRRALKMLSFKLPFRPFLRFTYQYGLRAGFLDGAQGLDYCLLLARYEGFISSEIRKMKASRARDS